jgi:Zn-dependent protease with chaperone function
MVRPISLFLLVMLLVASRGTFSSASPNLIGLLLCLVLIPCLSIVGTRFSQKYKITPLLATFAILLSWSASIFLFYWATIPKTYLSRYFILDEFLILLPALFWLGALWFVTSPIKDRYAWVLHRFRLDVLLLFIPVSLLVVLSNSIPFFGLHEGFQLIELFGFLVLMGCAPFFITRILSAKPMKNYELQCSIEEVGFRAGVRRSRIFVWNTHNRIMNALAIGILFQPRTIVLTDKLIASLTQKELLSVTAHEFGHHKYWHIPFLLLTAVASMVWLEKAYAIFGLDVGHNSSFVTQLIFIIFAIIVVSRQFEEQADAYAAVDNSRVLGETNVSKEGALTMSSALGVIATTQNINIFRNDPMHGSIAARQHKLRALVGCSFTDIPINKKVFWIKIVLCASLLLGFVV